MNNNKIKIEKVGTTSVIFVKGVKGDGTRENPAGEIVQFYLPSGTFIGEIDRFTAIDFKKSIQAVDEWQAAIDGEPFALKKLSRS